MAWTDMVYGKRGGGPSLRTGLGNLETLNFL